MIDLGDPARYGRSSLGNTSTLSCVVDLEDPRVSFAQLYNSIEQELAQHTSLCTWTVTSDPLGMCV